MPANLSPDYKKAEQAFREASDDRDRLLRLRDMLRTIPKHKGTEHLQADIKSRIKQLTEELAGPKRAPPARGRYIRCGRRARHKLRCSARPMPASPVCTSS